MAIYLAFQLILSITAAAYTLQTTFNILIKVNYLYYASYETVCQESLIFYIQFTDQ